MKPHDGTLARFMRRVQKTETCWLWTGPRDKDGYAKAVPPFHSGHVLTYTMLAGEVPAGLELDHTCSVRHCVNPDHLEPVTHAENRRRAAARQTHCNIQGHRYTAANTYIRPSGHRDCRTCIRARVAAYRSRRAAA